MLLICLCGQTSRVTKVGDHNVLHLGPVTCHPETMRNAVECGQPQSCILRQPSEQSLEAMCLHILGVF